MTFNQLLEKANQEYHRVLSHELLNNKQVETAEIIAKAKAYDVIVEGWAFVKENKK